MQVITTKHLAPTNTKGSRFKATCAAGSITLGHEYAYGHEQNHRAAAEALREKLGWPYHMVSGQDVHGNYQHVLLHANMAAPSKQDGIRKYRSHEVERVHQAMQHTDAGTNERKGTLKLSYNDQSTRYLSVDTRDVAALLDLFNQVDES